MLSGCAEGDGGGAEFFFEDLFFQEEEEFPCVSLVLLFRSCGDPSKVGHAVGARFLYPWHAQCDGADEAAFDKEAVGGIQDEPADEFFFRERDGGEVDAELPVCLIGIMDEGGVFMAVIDIQ